MIRFAFLVSLFALVSACSDGGGSSESKSVTDKQNTFKPEDFVLNQVNTLTSYGESQVIVTLNNLVTDDAIYVSVASDQLENKKLQVTPYKTVLNPNKGTVEVTLNVTDQGTLSAPQIKVIVTTSGNASMEQTLNMEWQIQ
jgi:hypothetical protein